MKLRKLALSGLMLAVLLIACITLLPAEADAAGAWDLTFELNYYGTGYEVTDCNNAASGALTIPATYQGKPVTRIAWVAFDDCTSLTSVTIPNSVTSIGESAFRNCSSLTTVTIPDSVTTIDVFAFDECASLTSVTIGSGTTHIKCSFSSCPSLTGFWVDKNNPNYSSDSYGVLFNKDKSELIQAPGAIKTYCIPNSVTSIGYEAFSNCANLTSLTIPASVTTCDIDVFNGTSSLTGFWVDKNNPNYSSDSYGVLFNKDKTELIQAPGAIKTYCIPNSVTSIGYGAFSNCTSLTSVTIPGSVTSIDDYAFDDCSSLTSVTIPDSVTSIGYGAFASCDSLTNATIGNGITTIEWFAFCDCDSLTTVTIPNSVTAIDTSAFNDCDSLTTVIIPNSVTTIGNAAFSDCDNLTTVIIPNSVTTIGSVAFRDCTRLTSVTIGDSVKNIGFDAFSGCSGLKSVTIPDSVTSIGWSAFSGCTSLKSVTIPDSVISIEGYAFRGCTSLKKVYYGGSQAQWKEISISYENAPLDLAEKIYNYKVYTRSATVTATAGANIWSKPYTSNDSKKVRTAAYNSKLSVVDKVINSSGSLWYQLSDGNWVYSTNIRVTDYNPADVEYINKVFVVTSWGANVWSKPYSSGDSEVIRSEVKTAALKAVAQVRNSTGGLWYMLEGGGWIYSKNVNERIFDPADVIAYKRSATVIVPGVINIWGQPSTKAPSTLTRTAAYQTKLNVVAKYTTPTGGLWYQLTDGNWVYSSNIRITDYNPADVQKVNKTVTVTSWGANVWSKPYSSGDSKVVKTVAKAANLKIDGQVRNSTYGLWYRLADGSGWIYSQNVKVK